MPAPVVSFIDPTSITPFFAVMPIPLSNPTVFSLSLTHALCILPFRFKKWGLVLLSNRTKLEILKAPQLRSPRTMTKLMIITFPAVYKERGSKSRPSLGQLWPRTR